MVVAMIGKKRKQALVRIVVVVGGVTNIKSDLTEESKAEDLRCSISREQRGTPTHWC